MKIWSDFSNFILLVKRFALMMLIYTILRIGFYLFNMDLFPQVTFSRLPLMLWGGVKFDVVALLYFNIGYILMMLLPFPFTRSRIYQKVADYVFIVTNSIGVLLNMIDFVYFPFTLKRTTGTVFGQFSHESNLGKLTLDFLLDYWYLSVLFILFVFLLIRILPKSTSEKVSFQWKTLFIQIGILLFSAFLFIGGVRGGWAHSTRPITLSNAGDYVESPEEMYIVLNTPFSMLKTMKSVNLQKINYFPEKELEQIYNPVHYPQPGTTFESKNVVFLILESFAKEHFGSLNKDLLNGTYKGYTPFLDSLIAESYTFTDTYANGRKSIDALPSVISGIPSMGEPFVLSIYSSNKTTSIPNLLKQKGYETAFFHGAPNGSMGFSAYTKMAGIDHYFGKNEYNNDQDFDGIWGIWDEPFMQFMGDKLNTFKQPFFASFFSVSSHHPFKVPEKYARRFPKGPLPVQEPIGYTDYALKQFFAKVSKMPWFKNTVFVICADHATVSYLPEYKTAVGGYKIPIIFYAPGDPQLKGKSQRLVQQIDIMPTVLNYLHYDKPYFAFGFDAFSKQNDNFVINSNGNIYNFFYKDYYMSYENGKPHNLFDLKQDVFLKHDLIQHPPQILDTMQTKIKAFIQQYNNRMIENRLIVNP